MLKAVGFLCVMALVLLAAVSLMDRHEPIPVQNPNPAAELKQHYNASKVASTAIGNPIEVDGCQVQLHEVFIAMPDEGSNTWSMTMATAKCPTAQTTAVHENCGKNCTHNTLRVEPVTPAAVQPVPAVEHTNKAKPSASAILQRVGLKQLDQLELEIAQTAPEVTKRWESTLSSTQRREHQQALLRARNQKLDQLQLEMAESAPGVTQQWLQTLAPAARAEYLQSLQRAKLDRLEAEMRQSM